MSQRKRRIRERSLRQRVVHQKALRRRARLAAARPAAAVVTAAALTMAGGGLPAAASATSAGTVGSAAPAAARGTLSRPAAPVMGAAAAGCGNPHTPTSDPADFVDVAGRLFFTADDGVHGRELWTSDGTKAGTVLVKDIKPGSPGRRLRSLLPDRRGREVVLHRRRRHPRAGAVDVGRHQGGHGPGQGHQPGRRRRRQLGPSYLTGVGGRLFFTADDGTHGPELWTSDGTRAGTVLVKDIKPRRRRVRRVRSPLPDRRRREVVLHRRRRHPRERAVDVGRHQGGHRPGQGHQPRRRADYDYAPSSLTDVGARLFFAADDGTHGRELWTLGRHRGGHRPGQGHQPRRLRQRPLLPDRCRGKAVLHRAGRHPRA